MYHQHICVIEGPERLSSRSKLRVQESDSNQYVYLPHEVKEIKQKAKILWI